MPFRIRSSSIASALRGAGVSSVVRRSARETTPRSAEAIEDERIRKGMMAALRRQPWADVHYLTVEVKDGVVRLHGFHNSPEAQRAVRTLAEGSEGVRAVKDHTRPTPPVYRYGYEGM